MASANIGIIFIFLVGTTAAQYDPKICTFFNASYGLIPPPLPTNFELKGESVDHLHGFTNYEEWYFDYTNQRAKYMFMRNSIEHHFLYDYDTSQIIEWDILHPGVSIKRDPLSQVCTAVNMEDSPYRNVFGYQDAYSLRPKMYNANQALRYGGQYMYAANGTERISERGILTNKFIGCLYDASMDATMAVSFYFTDKKVLPSAATSMMEVTGFDDGYLSVPVKSEYFGTMTDDKGGVQSYNKTMSISWFKAEPKFKADAFQIPPWTHCSNYRGRKDIPKFPLAFSTRLVRTQFQVDTLGEMAATESESYEEIFYYAEKKLARRDFTPNPSETEIFSKFLSYTPVSTIYDFNQGLRYTINKPTGRCYIGSIHDNEFFDTVKPLLFRELATPEEIFLMETDEMEYKGKAFTRDIECDIWTGKYFDKNYNATYVKETYFSTNGWHEDADEMVEYGVPVKQVVIQKELNDELMEGVVTINFLKFKAKPPRLVLFDINNCVEHINHKRFGILLTANDDITNLLFKYKFYFLETAQYYLTDVSQVKTPLRVQRLQLYQKKAPTTSIVLTFLVFTLLDKADLGSSVVVGQTGANLDEAVVNLQKLLSRGDFSISFFPPRSKEETIVSVEPGSSLFIVEADGQFTSAPLRIFEDFAKEESDSDVKPPVVQYDDDKVKIIEDKGMKPGHLALLSFSMLVIGVGIGIAVMYLYIRMHSERQVVDRIKLTTTNG